MTSMAVLPRAEPAVRWLTEHAGTLGRLCASYTRTPAERDDLMQDIAVALLQAQKSFRGECSERTFVLRIAHNRAFAALTRRGKRNHETELDERALDVSATTGKNPALVYERHERQSRLLAAVRALPVSHRQVLTLLLEGLSQKEIGAVLGIAEGAVAVRATRARAALRVLLGPAGEEEEAR